MECVRRVINVQNALGVETDPQETFMVPLAPRDEPMAV